MAEAAPQLKEEVKAPLVTQRKLIPMQVSSKVKDKIRQRSLRAPEELYVDKPIEEGGFNSFACDGRENLDPSVELIRVLLRKHDRSRGECAYLSIAPAKVTICGTDEQPLLVTLNGRQRLKAITCINARAQDAYSMWENMPGGKSDENRAKLKNQLIAMAAAGHNDPEGPAKDWALFYQDGEVNEAIECLLGGRIGGVYQLGFLTRTRETTEGPLPFYMRVEYTDVDPNDKEALHISIMERVSVDTPPLVVCQQIKALVEAGDSWVTIADGLGISAREVVDRLMVLNTIPEVQKAYNEKKISLKLLIDNFFSPTQRGKKVKDPAEQLRLINKYAPAPQRGGGLTQAKLVEQEKSWPKDLKCAGCGKIVFAEVGARLPNGQFKHQPPDCTHEAGKGYANGEPLTSTQVPEDVCPGVKNVVIDRSKPAAQPAAQPQTGTPTPNATPKRKAASASVLGGVFAHLPRAAVLLGELAERQEPKEGDGREEILAKTQRRAKFEAASLLAAYIGGKIEALDSDPVLKDAVIEALAQAQIDAEVEVDKKIVQANTTQAQNDMMALNNAITTWESMDPDERPEWPNVDGLGDGVRQLMSKIQTAYAEKLSSGDANFEQNFKGRVGDFALQWLIDQG